MFRSWKTKGPRPVRLNTAKTVFVHQDSKKKLSLRTWRNCFLCIMIPFDETFIIKKDYEFWWNSYVKCKYVPTLNTIYFTLSKSNLIGTCRLSPFITCWLTILPVWLAINSEQINNQIVWSTWLKIFIKQT